MSDKWSPALTPEQWEARDYRQAARELDSWAEARTEPARADDSTEYVAKLGLDESGSVIVRTAPTTAYSFRRLPVGSLRRLPWRRSPSASLPPMSTR
jgi:hypothetical protein